MLSCEHCISCGYLAADHDGPDLRCPTPSTFRTEPEHRQRFTRRSIAVADLPAELAQSPAVGGEDGDGVFVDWFPTGCPT